MRWTACPSIALSQRQWTPLLPEGEQTRDRDQHRRQAEYNSGVGDHSLLVLGDVMQIAGTGRSPEIDRAITARIPLTAPATVTATATALPSVDADAIEVPVMASVTKPTEAVSSPAAEVSASLRRSS